MVVAPHRLRSLARPGGPPRRAEDPGAAARGILVALALSCLAWVALALAVPLLW